eukprot:30352-Amphidinium_carterae.1
MGAIHVLALNKNTSGEIRPISIPSIWRKLLSSMIVTFHQDDARAYLGTRQHGVGMPSGIYSLLCEKDSKPRCGEARPPVPANGHF